MKANIHPTWYNDAKVSCVCGNTFTTGSTQAEIHVELCSKCHPFYTGTQKLVDTQGQVERFEKAKAASEVKKLERVKILEHRATVKKARNDENKQTLKDLLMQARKG